MKSYFMRYINSYRFAKCMKLMKKVKPKELESDIFMMLALRAWVEPDEAFDLWYGIGMFEHNKDNEDKWSLEDELKAMKRDGVDYDKKIKQWGGLEGIETQIHLKMCWYGVLINMICVVYDKEKDLLKWKTDCPEAQAMLSDFDISKISEKVPPDKYFRVVFPDFYRFTKRYRYITKPLHRLHIFFHSVKMTFKKIVSKKFRKEWEEKEGGGMTSREVINSFGSSISDEKLAKFVFSQLKEEEHSIGFWAFVRLCERHGWLNNWVDKINREDTNGK